jgi:hypothetical protein
MIESGNKTQDILNSYVDGVLTERERIIKLLEAELTCDECDMNGFENNIPDKAIAIIKGEK